jgi:hypothetical protein
MIDDGRSRLTAFLLTLWGIIIFFAVLLWRRYPPGSDFRRASLFIAVLASCILPVLALIDMADEDQRGAADQAADAAQLDKLQRAWRANHPRLEPEQSPKSN